VLIYELGGAQTMFVGVWLNCGLRVFGENIRQMHVSSFKLCFTHVCGRWHAC